MGYQTKRYLRDLFSKLDIRVLIAFVIIISFGIIIFMYQVYNHVDCEKTDFIIEAHRKQVGEVIEFYDKTPNAKSWKWDFGDGSPTQNMKNPLHKYSKPGYYIVTLTINGSCPLQKTIEIKDLGQIIDSMKVPKIIVPQSITVGQPIDFYYTYKGEAFSWEWSFGESGQMDNTSEFPIYSYNTPGIKKITLVINGNVSHIASKDIYVRPRRLVSTKKDTIKSYVYEKDPNLFELPQGNPQKDPLEEYLRNIPSIPVITPTEKKIQESKIELAPNISEAQFEILLLDVAKQSKTQEDFSKYTCGNYNFPIVRNDKEILTFSEFCDKIKNQQIKIKSLRITRNNRNCIEGLRINYKVKKLLVWIYD